MSTTKEIDTVAEPFGKEVDHVILDSERGDGYDPSLYATDNLGSTAAAGLDDEGPAQDALDIPEPEQGAKVSFLGVKYDDVKQEMSLGDEVSFIVTGTVTEDGMKIMADSHRRRQIKVTVDSVKPVA